jgi:hypothetical protein
MRWMLCSIVVAACAPSPQGPVHAPGAPESPSPVSTAIGGSAPAPTAGWFCYEKRSGESAMSWCERSLDACTSAAEADMGAAEPGESWSVCAAADRAFCYGFRVQKDQRAVQTCVTSEAECTRVSAAAVAMSSRVSESYPIAGSVTPCVELP